MKEQINKILKAQTFEYAKELIENYLKTSEDSTHFFSELRCTMLNSISFNNNSALFELLEYVEKNLYAANKFQIEHNNSLKIAVSWSELDETAKHCCITLLSMGCKFGQLTAKHKFFDISHKILSSGWYFNNIHPDIQHDIMSGLCKKVPENNIYLRKNSALLQILDSKIKITQCISLNHISWAQNILLCNPVKDNCASFMTFLLCIKHYKDQNVMNVPKVLTKFICDIIIIQDLNHKVCVLINQLGDNKKLSFF